MYLYRNNRRKGKPIVYTRAQLIQNRFFHLNCSSIYGAQQRKSMPDYQLLRVNVHCTRVPIAIFVRARKNPLRIRQRQKNEHALHKINKVFC